MRTGILTAAVLLWAAIGFSQSLASRCDLDRSLEDRLVASQNTIPGFAASQQWPKCVLDHDVLLGQGLHEAASHSSSGALDPVIAAREAENEGFHWRRALTESLTFLLIEQA